MLLNKELTFVTPVSNGNHKPNLQILRVRTPEELLRVTVNDNDSIEVIAQKVSIQ